MTNDGISLYQYAHERGLPAWTIYRWARAGKLGPVSMRPGAKVKGRRLSRSWLIQHGMLEPEPQPNIAEWSAVAADVLQVIVRHARQTLDADKLVQFLAIWHELWARQ